MGYLRKIFRKIKIKIFTYRTNHFPSRKGINIADDLMLGRYINIYVALKANSIDIAPQVHIKEFCNLMVGENAQLVIGRNVFINNYTSINCLDKIVINENCQIGEGVKFYDHNHKYTTDPIIDVKKNEFNTAPIVIGRSCWIGSNVIILKGVTLGDNVIIGANNLIYKSIPSNSIVKAKVDYQIEQF